MCEHARALTFDNQGHDGVGDAKRVARDAAVGTVVLRAGVEDGDDGTVRANFNIVCRTKRAIHFSSFMTVSASVNKGLAQLGPEICVKSTLQTGGKF